ncbi:MAG: hypothetical protein IJ837_01195 [Clostridia bacterium]|nr:hypothetical protein [Clostridia bacterium]
MNFKSPSFIIFCSLILITIVSFCLIQVADAFAIIGSLGLSVIFFWLTVVSFFKYKLYKNAIEDQKNQEAYRYAEEMGNEDAVKDFEYSRKERRQLKNARFNHSLAPYTFLALTGISIFLFLICAKII